MCHDQAGGFESYCVPVDDYLPSGYSRPTCQNGDGNSYLSGPGGQTSFTQAEILAMCDASLPEVLYYTRCTDESSDVNRCEIYASIDGTVPVGYYPTPYTSSDEAQVQCDQLSGGDCPGISSASICGDGVINAGEQCDDGNNTNGDNCDESCQREDVVVSAGSNQTPTPNTIGGVNTLADTAIVSDEFDRIIIGLVLVIGGFVTIRLRIFDRFFEEKRFKTIDITK
jgi:cysteine-rich repeat protein